MLGLASTKKQVFGLEYLLVRRLLARLQAGTMAGTEGTVGGKCTSEKTGDGVGVTLGKHSVNFCSATAGESVLTCSKGDEAFGQLSS